MIACTIRRMAASGRGECVPYRRYGETMESVRRGDRGRARRDRRRACDRDDLLGAACRQVPRATRSTARCGTWRPRLSGDTCRQPDLRNAAPRRIVTAYTLSLGTPEAMAAQARANADRPLLKVKIGGEGDIARIRAVVEAAPDSRIILDANEGWTDDNIAENLAVAAELGVALIEQPLPAGQDAILRRIAHPVPICADESVHTADGSRQRLSGSTTRSTSSSTRPAA